MEAPRSGKRPHDTRQRQEIHRFGPGGLSGAPPSESTPATIAAYRIPWSAVTTATTYEAPGWFRPPSEPGTLIQAAYDPNYTGTFVELVVGEPPVFLQLPADLLGEGMSRLPLATTGQVVPVRLVRRHGDGTISMPS